MKDVLPTRRTVADVKTKVYLHVQIDPEIVQRLKRTASERGYKPGEFLEQLLDTVLPKVK